MKARDVMTAQPATVSSRDSVSLAAQVMRTRGIGMLPVVEEVGSRKLCGVITDRDIVVRCVAGNHGTSCTVGAHMTAMPLATVKADDDVAMVLSTMERNHVRRLPVVSNDGLLVGIVAQADLALKVGHDAPALIEHLLESISEPVLVS